MKTEIFKYYQRISLINSSSHPISDNLIFLVFGDFSLA